MRRLVFAVGIALALAGCSSTPDHGRVVNTKYEAPYDYWVPGSCIPVGQTTVCNPGYPATEPEKWSLELYDQDAKDKDEARGWRVVPKSAFDRCPRGSQFPECAGGHA